jgi:hypothetical protein
MVFQDGDLRYVRFGDKELIRRVYLAVRDVNWLTIPGERSQMQVESSDESFSVSFNSSHDGGGILFDSRVSIEGSRSGVVTFAIEGVARGGFRYCRIGLCVLHPIRECAGRPYRALTPDGSVSGVLPVDVEPPRLNRGVPTPIFPSFSDLRLELAHGLTVHARFEGDLFEMEDQRNWTDGSFKTYGTPLALGYPHTAEQAQRFRQSVTFSANRKPRAGSPTRTRRRSPESRLTIGKRSGQPMPRLGFGMASHGEELSERERTLLKALRPDHLRADLHLGTPLWQEELARGWRAAAALETSLELGVFLSDRAEEQLASLRRFVTDAPVARVIVFHEAEAAAGTTSERWMRLARSALAETLPGVPLAGGTTGNFARLNRDRPAIDTMDAVSYAINPQVHSSDEASLIEALEPQADTVATARGFCGDLPILVSSVTLKPPFNNAARETQALPPPGELPPEVDRRQMSLFAAAWTVGSLRSLWSGGAASLTYYETTGWRGLLETATGSRLPTQFPSRSGMVFPVYHVFADLADVKGADLVPVDSSQPLRLSGLALASDGGFRLMVSNLTPLTQQAVVGPVPGKDLRVRRLNAQSAGSTMFSPERFRQTHETVPVHEGELALTLLPYETLRADVADGTSNHAE